MKKRMPMKTDLTKMTTTKTKTRTKKMNEWKVPESEGKASTDRWAHLFFFFLLQINHLNLSLRRHEVQLMWLKGDSDGLL